MNCEGSSASPTLLVRRPRSPEEAGLVPINPVVLGPGRSPDRQRREGRVGGAAQLLRSRVAAGSGICRPGLEWSAIVTRLRAVSAPSMAVDSRSAQELAGIFSRLGRGYSTIAKRMRP